MKNGRRQSGDDVAVSSTTASDTPKQRSSVMPASDCGWREY